MITPIKAMTISQIVARQDDMLVSVDDVKEIAKNERADERAKIKEMFKMYQRLEIKFTLNQCKEKDGLYYLDATDLFNGLVDQVIDSEEQNNERED